MSTALTQAAATLIPLFRTDFTRTLWNLQVDGAEVEAAIDQGEITAEVNGETRRTPICEIELELKGGDEAALHTLAAELAQALPGLAPDDISKAQRGYKLREG